MALTYTHFLSASGLMGTELDAGVTVMIRTESGGWGLGSGGKVLAG